MNMKAHCASLYRVCRGVSEFRSATSSTLKACAAALLLLTVAPSAATAAESVNLDLPPRLQWGGNYGYCGEVSFVAAGLYFGQYISQYDARALATDGIDQSREDSQLLLDENEGAAAEAMRLEAEIWSGDTTEAFLLWIKRNLMRGAPVLIGVFENTSVFDIHYANYDNIEDYTYDHIVPVTGYVSRRALSDAEIHPDDEIQFSDNGDLKQNGKPKFQFAYPVARFLANREEQSLLGGQPYFLGTRQNDGIAITGVQDRHGDTLPVRIAVDLPNEPEIEDGSDARPAPVPLSLMITVSGLEAGVDYILYRYSDFDVVPTEDFNANSGGADRATSIQIASGDSYTLNETIMSDDMAIYRAVRASAP